MSFYTKYQSLGLGDIELISWLKFDSNINDSGPYADHWTYAVGNGTSLLATPGMAYFTNASIEHAAAPTGSFTAFFDIEKVAAADDSVILSSVNDAGHFAFVWGPSGRFYILSKNTLGQLEYSGFFRVTETSKRCVFALSKFQNSFLIYVYDPFSDELETEFVTAPFDAFSDGTGLRLGDKTFGFGDDANFKLREFVLVKDGVPGFCILELCREIHAGSADVNFMFSWVSTAEKTGLSYVEELENVSRLNTNIVLPYSVAPEGFSLLGNDYDPVHGRVYTNGYVNSIFTLEEGYITYSGMSSSDITVADFFDGTQNADNYDVFTGSVAKALPKGTAVVFDDASGARLTENYILVSANSLSAGKEIIFPSIEGLTEI